MPEIWPWVHVLVGCAAVVALCFHDTSPRFQVGVGQITLVGDPVRYIQYLIGFIHLHPVGTCGSSMLRRFSCLGSLESLGKQIHVR